MKHDHSTIRNTILKIEEIKTASFLFYYVE